MEVVVIDQAFIEEATALLTRLGKRANILPTQAFRKAQRGEVERLQQMIAAAPLVIGKA